MDHQTTVNGSHGRESPAQALAGNAAALAHDLLTISELQIQLLIADLRRLWRGALWALGAWLVGLGLLAAAMPIALAGIGLWLADATAQTPAAGLLWVALFAVLLMAILIAAGWWQCRRQLAGLQRSRRELQDNLATLKRILSNYSNRPQESDQPPSFQSSTTTQL
jgi:hypothetical protein